MEWIFDEEENTRDELSLLEDYITLGGLGFQISVPRRAPDSYIENIQAAIISSRLGIGLDYARKTYVEKTEPSIPESYDLFQRIYFAGKSHIAATFERFAEGAKPEAGVLYAEVALRRLTSTYFAAGLLFRLGNLFEANSVARMFLEQTAWAYDVHTCRDWNSASRVSSTRAISKLKQIFPRAGVLYGLYSNDAHLELKQHPRFIRFEQPPKVLTALGPDSWMFGLSLLELADMFSCVYEYTQKEYILKPENWRRTKRRWALNRRRPFLNKISELTAEWRTCFESQLSLSKRKRPTKTS